MDDVSFWGIIALWLGLSVGLWWVFRWRKASRFDREITLAQRAKKQVGLAQNVFDTIRRTGFPLAAAPAGALEHETHALLKRVQKAGAFFDEVNVLNARVRRACEGEDCQPLAELLHIRRDLWAASEIVLMRDASMLGADFGDAHALDALRAEAVAVLFKDGSPATDADSDLIDLRLLLAREEAAKFVADIEAAIHAAREKDRLPSPREVFSHTVAGVRAVPGQIMAFWAHMARLVRYVLALAQRIRESKGMVAGMAELRRAREALPERIGAGAAGASALARRSAVQLRRHYEFLVTAHDLQARYAQGVRKGSEMTEHARQFIARLDLAARSERLRLTSASAFEWARRHIVLWVARAIAALPHVQARLDEARADMAKAAKAVQMQPFVLRWPPDDNDNKKEG